MPPHTTQELKKSLTEAGFLVFRTLGEEIILAERVRENLIMDSGVRLKGGSPLTVLVVLRVRRGDFPNEDEGHLYDRVTHLGQPAKDQGFLEVERKVSPVPDPGDPSRTLETFYEVTFARQADTLEAALDGVRFAMGLEKNLMAKSP